MSTSRQAGVTVPRDIEQIETQRSCRELADMARRSDDAIFSITTDGAIQTWNDGAERMYGYGAAEIVGRSVSVLASGNRVNEEDGILAQWKTGRELKGLELDCVRKDGLPISIQLTISPIRDIAGNVVGAVTIARDIGDKKHAQAVPHQSEEQYRLLFASNPIPMWVYDRKTLHFLAVNEAAIQQYGFTEQEFLAMSIMDIRPEEDIPLVLHDISSHGPGLQNRADWRHRKKDGTICDVEIVCNQVSFHGIGAMLVSAYDITDRKRAQEALRQAEEKYRGIFEDAVVGIFQTTPEGRPLSINRAMAELHGYGTPEQLMAEIQNVPLQLFVDPNRMVELAEIVAEKGVVRGAEVELYRKDRTRKWVRVNLRALRDTHGQIVLHEGTVEDVTEQKRTERKLQNSENKYRALFEQSGDATWLTDETGIIDCNSAALEMFGYPSVASMPHPILMSPPNQSDGTPSQPAGKQKVVEAHLKGKVSFEWLHQRKNGEIFPAEVCLTGLTLSGRQVELASVRDITQRKQAEEALLFKTALLEAQAETTMDGILVVDESDRIVLANKQFGFSFGIPDDLLKTCDASIARQFMLDKVVAPDLFLETTTQLNNNRVENSMDELTLKNGKIFDRYSAPLVDANGRYRGRIWYIRDITKRKAAEERIQFLAYYDALTELPQRVLLQDRLDSALASTRRRNEKIAVLSIDLDRFKEINDLFGHDFGDTVLKDVAKRLKDCAREQDTVSRVGGDEFIVLLTGVRDAVDVALVAERIMDAIRVKFIVHGQPLSVRCSIGVSMFPDHGVGGESLIRNASAAMHSAKMSRRSTAQFFTEEMNVRAEERLTMDRNLRLALERDEFFLEYQPQMEIRSGRLTGLEALIRWRHPEMGLIPPDRFISVAENNGLILPIGEWVLNKACAQARNWQDAGLLAVPVAVNVSAAQFRQDDFPELIHKALQDTHLAPQYLELEITESLLLSDKGMTLPVLHKLKEMGLKLAIDDFGTGYSCLSYLKQFPVDKLKIDKSFIRDVVADDSDAAITTAIISMAKSLHLKVIAEGVEDGAQLSFLRELGCDEIQGYFFGKPMSADDVAPLLRSEQGYSMVA